MEGKIDRYFKYRKVTKYLKSKDESQYNILDKIFKYYVDGHLEKLLSNYPFSKIEIYSQIDKKANSLQINFWYYNLVVGIDFCDSSFDHVIYLPCVSPKDFDKSFIKSNYNADFNIEKFFEDFYAMLQKDSRLIKS